MAKNLVIVESPAKAKTIEKILGKDFKVASSFGHIADLPSKELGVNVDDDFTAKYEVSIDKKKIMASLKAGKIPVISPIGWTSKDEPMNINGDFAACAVAASLKAEKIILLTDISGVRDLDGKKISTMSLKEAKRVLKNKKNIKGGMYPKLTGAIDCLEKGVKNAHIVDGRVPHSVLIELLTDKGVGTWISK